MSPRQALSVALEGWTEPVRDNEPERQLDGDRWDRRPGQCPAERWLEIAGIGRRVARQEGEVDDVALTARGAPVMDAVERDELLRHGSGTGITRTRSGHPPRFGGSTQRPNGTSSPSS